MWFYFEIYFVYRHCHQFNNLTLIQITLKKNHMSLLPKEHFEFCFPPRSARSNSFCSEEHIVNRPRNVSYQPYVSNVTKPHLIIQDSGSQPQSQLMRPPQLLLNLQSSDHSQANSESSDSKFFSDKTLSTSLKFPNYQNKGVKKIKLDNYLNQKFQSLRKSQTDSTCQGMKNIIDISKERITSISDFKIVKLLGKGSFSKVYLAIETNIGFICVLKFINKKKVAQQKCEQNIFRQLKIQIMINHPNTVKSYGFFADSENIYIIQEYAGKKNLYSLFKTLTVKEGQIIIRQITKAVSYLHRLNILHRDLKLENIVLHQGVAKVCDFGCAVLSSNPRTTFVGSIAYLSPEQVTKEKYGKKKDIWSIGIIAHQLFFGYSPFEQEIFQNLGYPISERRFPMLKFEKLKEKNLKASQFLADILQPNEIIRMDAQQILNHPFLND